MDLTCDVCCKSFTMKSNLTRHQTVHQEKSVICPQCDKAFTLQQHLKHHLSQLKEYFIRIAFQAHSSPHAHCTCTVVG